MLVQQEVNDFKSYQTRASTVDTSNSSSLLPTEVITITKLKKI